MESRDLERELAERIAQLEARLKADEQRYVDAREQLYQEAKVRGKRDDEMRAMLNQMRADISILPTRELADQMYGDHGRRIEQLQRDRSNFLSRTEYDSRHEDLRKRIEALERGESGQSAGALAQQQFYTRLILTAGAFTGVAGVVVALIELTR